MSILLEDLDSIILSHCDLEDDFFNIMIINRYYCKLVNNDGLFLSWKKLHLSKMRTGYIHHNFQFSCYYGCMLYGKYLLNKYPEINIHAYNDFAFRYSCQNGHLDVAKWLLDLSNKQINSYTINAVFKWTCATGRLDIAKWLTESLY